LPLDAGVGLGPAQHPLEDRPSPEHPAGFRVFREDRVVDAEPRQRIANLEATGPAADDDESIGTGREWLLG